jgi:hypothetical protein
MTSAAPTRVYLTVDVECAEERVRNGRVSPTLGYDLRVWGRFSNQSEDLGIPLILRELGRHGQKATFFVEALGRRHFGEDGLRQVVARLVEDGQDVQLHTHPIQQRADWHTRGEPAASDDIAKYAIGEQEALLRDGLDTLVRCGADRASLVGFRAGNYAASNATWQAMRAVGLRVSSNLNMSYRDKTCYIRWPRQANALFATDVPGVWELPISNFQDRPGRLRHVQITAISLSEMKHYLLEARRLGLAEVTIVTHSFEFSRIDSAAARSGRPDETNIRRLRGLLAFLADRPRDFQVDTVGALGLRLRDEDWVAGRAPDPAALVPYGRTELLIGRYLEQAMRRLSTYRHRFA